MIDTTNWAKFPFTVDGVEFVSMQDELDRVNDGFGQAYLALV